MSRYQFIEQAAATEPVQVLCRVLHYGQRGILSVVQPINQAYSYLEISGYCRF